MKKHQSLLVGITALCIMGGMIGILANCTGILFAAIIQDMGFKAGALSLYYTIKSIVSALTLTFTIKLALSKNSRYFMALFGVLAAASFIIMAFFSAIWEWYLSAVLCGFAVGCIFTAIPIILNNWFRKNNGLIIGLVMSGSGLAGTIFSPIMSRIIGMYGWRKAAIVTGLLNIILVSFPSLLFLKPSPENTEEESGISGNRKESGISGSRTESGTSGSRTESGISGSRTESLLRKRESLEKPAGKKNNRVPAWVFPICLLTVLFPALQITFANQITVFSMSIGYTLAVGGTMTSLAMIGNVSGKFLLGLLADKIGIFRGMLCMLALDLLSLVLFLCAGRGEMIAYLAALSYGFLYSLYSTGPSLFMLQIYGREHYAEKFSRIQAINTLICALGSSGVAYIYDLSGSFTPVFVMFLGMTGLTILFVILLAANHYEK